MNLENKIAKQAGVIRRECGYPVNRCGYDRMQRPEENGCGKSKKDAIEGAG